MDDEKGVCDFLSILFNKEGHEVKTTQDPNEALKIVDEWRPEIALIDLRMPEIDGLSLLSRIKERDPTAILILITAYASMESAIEAMRRGAFDYITKPFKIEEIKLVIKRVIETQKLREENIRLRKELEHARVKEELVGTSRVFQNIINMVNKVAGTDSTILIQGESGTGKELIAREIHRLSLRREGPFVAVNCGALPETLLESELFGYVKGSFTGAFKDKDGLFKAANKGTLFLDEISAASPKIQVGLLRVLEQKEVTPVGSTSTIPVDVRLITATNQDLDQKVKNGEFRDDLYYRVNVISIRMPPLRERREDIPLLIQYFFKKYCSKYGIQRKRFSAEAMQLLLKYDWPGNVRELENVIEREIVLEESPVISVDSLPDKIREIGQAVQFIPKSMQRIHEREKQIFEYLKTHETITSKICSLEFKISQRTARNHLRGLVNKKLICRKGSGKKNTYYVVNTVNKGG